MDTATLVAIICGAVGAITGALAAYFGMHSHIRKQYEALGKAEVEGLKAENRALEARIGLLRLADNVSWVEAVQGKIKDIEQYTADLEAARGDDHEKHAAAIEGAQAQIAKLQAGLDASEAERRRAEQKLDQAIAAAGVTDEPKADAIRKAAFSAEDIPISFIVEAWNAAEPDPIGALHRAASDGDAFTIQVYLAARFDVNGCYAEGETALHLAAQEGRPEAAGLLLRGGASVNLQDVHGHTALYRAAASGRREVARVLLDAGADVNLRDEHGLTPLDIAIRRKHSDVVELLREHGAEE